MYNSIEDWMAANKLVINGDKTHLLLAANRAQQNKRENVTFCAGGFNIEQSVTFCAGGFNIEQSDNEKLLVGIVSGT